MAFRGSGEAQPIVKEFNSIADLRANNQNPFSTTAPFSAHLAAYYCLSSTPCPPVVADGGEGFFVAGKTGCTSLHDDDGGSIIVDTLGTCWYRQNVNGDLRQFGATLGSGYDCSGGGIDSCTPVDGSPNILLNAQTATKAAGIHRLTTSGVQIYLANPFSTDKDIILDGGVGSPDVSNHTISSPGTIWTTDSTTPNTIALTLGSGSVLQKAAVMPHWIGQNLYDWGATPGGVTYLDQQQILSHMVNTGQTGVACTNPNCGIVNAVVAGYDTAIEASGNSTLLDEVSADGNACIYFHDSGAATHWRNVTCHPSSTSDGVTEMSKAVA